jgi:alginate O-acetyltransferase complex protein AlgI
MLFNSFVFIFGFLPLTFVLFYAAGRLPRAAKLVLTVLSLGFYAWWNPKYLVILCGSIVFNYAIGDIIQKHYAAGRQKLTALWLTIGVVTDVALLGWFKYANFLVDNLNALGAQLHLAKIALPLAISFFTFQKIAYLVDSARGDAKHMKFLDFFLFASFFPQLISGPITHYKEVVPQFQTRRFGRLIWRNVLVGLAIFAIGLFKKTVIADTLSGYANPLFGAPAMAHGFNPATGWLAAITFTLQVYFDFSGYSDMAIGLGRMFGVKLPLNFHSPFRARDIAEYWRRWHMTLQRFIVAYIFQPLTIPLSRLAATRGMGRWSSFALSIGFPLFVTFVIVGIWHGAGWTFVLFGVMHAIYLCVNQVWLEHLSNRKRALRKLKKTLPEPGRLRILACHVLTLIAVLVSNVMFRARTVPDALNVWRGMAGLTRVPSTADQAAMFGPGLAASLALGVVIVFLMPNTQQIMGRFDPARNWDEWRDHGQPAIRWTWRPSALGLAFIAATLFLGVLFIQRGQAVFIYFNF